jgi:ribosome-associated translation inhibitor RaiA
MKVIELIGFDDFAAETVEDVKRKMIPLADKYGKMFGTENIQSFRVALETFKKDGGKDTHELTMTINTTKGDFRAKKQGWELLTLVDEVESVMERQIREKKEKDIKRRGSRNA